MAGADSGSNAKLTGLSKIFNGHTFMGRANVAKATYASFALLAMYFYFKPSKK
ncbi:CLUMA_CG000644, isoform A [Clunio marinus]|uniref:CLUMA_CG000644, isoform A n=1 Tax=Clunio marinus TaxID=568069 RepID=A0A1J1HFL5_9DIPT|nr:CLUMA_CG000644, isoform A [Clunio marinus]